MIDGAFLLLRALPEAARWGLIVAVIGGGTGVLTVIHHKIYKSGYDAAIASIAAQDREAVDAANQARARVRDCDARDGMRWDQFTGQCAAR